MKKFVILTTQRTGSTLLWKYMDGHPNIKCHGEMFLKSMERDDSFASFRKAGFKNYLKHYLFRNALLTDYLKKLYKKSENIKAVGYKLMYNQVFPELEQWIKINDVIIIHLIRKNTLKIILSRETAKKRGIYHAVPGQKVESIQVDLDPDHIKDEIITIEKEIDFFRDKFSNNKYMEISYEGFVADMELTTKKMLDFIELPQAKIRTIPLKKINTDSVKDLITNYQDILQSLIGTPFEEYVK